MAKPEHEATESGLWFYAALSRRAGFVSYRGKILTVAFAGTHVPLLGVVAFVLQSTGLPLDARARLMLVALAATLFGTAVTLWALNHLLAPIGHTARGLRGYLASQRLPRLPTRFADEAGLLMADTMFTLGRLDDTITHLRGYDRLTALPNRSLFEDRVGEAALRPGGAAVVRLDLAGFADFNAAHGHGPGDELLRAVGQRLAACLRPGETLARTGGDEFAVLSPAPAEPGGTADVDELARRVKRLLIELARPFRVGGAEAHVAACAGVAFGEGLPAAELLAHSASALAEAKSGGPGEFRFFRADYTARVVRRRALEVDLRGALDRGELHLHYQTQVSASGGRVTGVEALLRWRRPGGEAVSPAEFIPVAESTGLIVPIGEWVLRTACAQAARWGGDGPPPTVAVNLSARQFQQPDLVGVVARALAETGLDPARLELEVTESVVMGDAEHSLATLRGLRDLGVMLSLDDFGTGYSSLAYLKRFPFHALKIDRSFVRDLPGSGDDLAIVRSIVALAHSLRLDVVAEGVETQAQSACLSEHGCDSLQGFYFSRPLPAEALGPLLDPGHRGAGELAASAER